MLIGCFVVPVLEQLEDGNTENREFVDKYLGRFTELRGQMHNIQDRQKRLMFLHQTVMSGSQVRNTKTPPKKFIRSPLILSIETRGNQKSTERGPWIQPVYAPATAVVEAI